MRPVRNSSPAIAGLETEQGIISNGGGKGRGVHNSISICFSAVTHFFFNPFFYHSLKYWVLVSKVRALILHQLFQFVDGWGEDFSDLFIKA
jgi:hypothetical protein